MQVPTDNMWADIFTKNLGTQNFVKNRTEFLRMRPIGSITIADSTKRTAAVNMVTSCRYYHTADSTADSADNDVRENVENAVCYQCADCVKMAPILKSYDFVEYFFEF